ncbi:TIGR00294 family protein [Thermanaerovibrio velox DSM 12556]|uniref:GTP cyclohydrolase FolE2 n=1 Tax=Thermanaerovibrio velox DSM 12556 TaxID=926567 RepID=H0UQ27_9BACT|nr:GTP cyclohydrolase FolE2 [Thermanaerovibrio velox]EHM09656.1 TIGR00294 family protein [Thermanaerovibrio velox DSM 12556]
MRDLQSEADPRGVPIERVGIRGLTRPMMVMSKDGSPVPSVGTFSVFTDLPMNLRGTHMSRLAELASSWEGRVPCPRSAEEFLRSLIEALDARRGGMKVKFPYFVPKRSPVTDLPGVLQVQASVKAELDVEDPAGGLRFFLSVTTPVLTLCPCSKEISRFGAHNQRASVRIRVRSMDMIWIEELVEMAERNASSPLYPILKRRDERFVTESSYERPRFVEDLARDCALELKKHPAVRGFSVKVTSFESIHRHDAVAEVIG